LLEERYEHPPSHTIEADPQLLPRVFNFKEIKEGIHRRREAEAVAKDDESPHERPTVGMQLGGGNIHLG